MKKRFWCFIVSFMAACESNTNTNMKVCVINCHIDRYHYVCMVSKCKSKPQSHAGLLQIVFAVLALQFP